MTTVVINDFETNRRLAILFNHPHDFARADAEWEREDKLLIEMQKHIAFKERTRWCDLDPTHWRFLILEYLNKMAKLNDTEMYDTQNPVMADLTFLLTSFIKCLEERTEGTMELMRLNRVGENEVLYDYSGSVNMQLDFARPKKGFRVIVDNT